MIEQARLLMPRICLPKSSVRRVETPGGAAAIAGIQSADRKYGSVVGMVGVQRPYHALLGEVAHADPRSQESRRQTRNFWESNALERSYRSD